jgi:hypothetical protein
MESVNGLHEAGRIMQDLADVKAGLAQLTGTVEGLASGVRELTCTIRGHGTDDGVLTRLRLIEARIAVLEVEAGRRTGWIWQVAGVLGGGLGMWLAMRAIGG